MSALEVFLSPKDGRQMHDEPSGLVALSLRDRCEQSADAFVNNDSD